MNESLFKMKLADTLLCTFCQREKETVNHIFLECEHSKSLWNDTQNWLEGDLPNINSLNVVLGFVERQFYGRTENFLLLLCKRFTDFNRFSNKCVRFEGFKVSIKGIMKIEQKIASKNNKLPQHFQK